MSHVSMVELSITIVIGLVELTWFPNMLPPWMTASMHVSLYGYWTLLTTKTGTGRD